MEVNDYLPTRTRALSSSTPGSVESDLIKEATTVDLPLDKEKIYGLINAAFKKNNSIL